MARPKNLNKKLIKGIHNCGASYRQISKHLSISKSTIAYHLGKGVKQQLIKYRKQQFKKNPMFVLGKKADAFKRRKYIHKKKGPNKYKNLGRILNAKTNNFKRLYKGRDKMKRKNNTKNGNFSKDFTSKDVLKHIGGKDNARCYLTGKKLNLMQSESYHLDHILPSSKGGTNDLSNMGLATRNANQSKSDMTLEAYYQLCKDVLEHAGYSVTPPKI
tara:strand:+ start:786 stop:1433 length:648 start_codon:yes stop_codon:yes gene_type:complete